MVRGSLSDRMTYLNYSIHKNSAQTVIPGIFKEVLMIWLALFKFQKFFRIVLRDTIWKEFYFIC